MTYLAPTRADIRFRLLVSVAGFLTLAVILLVRGLPVDDIFAQASVLALIFLGVSSIQTGISLHRFSD